MTLTLTSPAFKNRETIPLIHTCDGANLSTPLRWSGVPGGTKALLVTCDDPDAPQGVFHHWAIYDVPPDWTGLETGIEPSAAGFIQGVNDFGRPGYGGPCPPRGDRPHAYHFRLSALRERLGGSRPPPSCAEVARRARALEIASAELIGYYGR